MRVSGTIDLTSGSLIVNSGMTIQGPGANALTLDGSGGSQVFIITSVDPANPAVRIAGATITGGSTSGSGAGVVALPFGPGTPAQLSIVDAAVTGNTADAVGGGVAVVNGSLEILRSEVSGNSADLEGGGIGTFQVSSVSVIDSTISGNATPIEGGGLYVADATGDVTIDRSIISDNDAGYSGGVHIGGATGPSVAVTIASSTISGNDAPNAGSGLFVGAPTEPVRVTNTTITANTGSSAVVLNNYYDVPVSFTGVTISGNTSDDGDAAVYRIGYDNPAFPGVDDVTLRNTVVAANPGTSATPDLKEITDFGSFVLSNSLIGVLPPSLGLVEDPPGSNGLDVPDPGLAPLASNGGPTPTMLPAPSSALIDAGVAGGPSVDQRGLPRTVNQPTTNGPNSDGTDIGAVELADTELTGAEFAAKRRQKQRGRKIVVRVKAGAGEDVTADASGAIRLGRKRVALATPSVAIASGESAALQLKPSKRGKRKVSRALGKGKKPKASVAVELSDSSGNTAEGDLSIRLKPKRKQAKGR